MKTKLIIIVSVMILSLSCTKQTITTQTSADEITTEVQKIIKDSNIKRIVAWSDKTGFPTRIPLAFGSS